MQDGTKVFSPEAGTWYRHRPPFEYRDTISAGTGSSVRRSQGKSVRSAVAEATVVNAFKRFLRNKWNSYSLDFVLGRPATMCLVRGGCRNKRGTAWNYLILHILLRNTLGTILSLTPCCNGFDEDIAAFKPWPVGVGWGQKN